MTATEETKLVQIQHHLYNVISRPPRTG